MPFLEDLHVTAKPSSPPFLALAWLLPVSPYSANVQTDCHDYDVGEAEDEEIHNFLTLLSTNTRYIHPHCQHIFDPSRLTLPINALAFIDPPLWITCALSGYT